MVKMTGFGLAVKRRIPPLTSIAELHALLYDLGKDYQRMPAPIRHVWVRILDRFIRKL